MYMCMQMVVALAGSWSLDTFGMKASYLMKLSQK